VKRNEKEDSPEGRLVAIGDIHGCNVALRALLEALDPRPDDTIVVLGDVIDYGPKTDKVIEHLIDLARRCRLILLEGNHEEMLFQALLGRDDRRYWESCGGLMTRRCYSGRDDRELIDSEHLQFLKENCRDYFETDAFIFLHANYYPNRPMEQQTSFTLRWEAVEPARMVPHYSGKTVIAGHTPQTSGDVLDLGFLVLIDTGCSRGGWITALQVANGQMIQANQRGETRRFCRIQTTDEADRSEDHGMRSSRSGPIGTLGFCIRVPQRAFR
jgi:serine/threonine protein phosphatase 1